MAKKKEHIKIQTENLSVQYSGRKALDDVTMGIIEKDITAIIGPSGCGKSTFLRSLNRMNDLVEGVKVSGKVVIDEQNIYDASVNVTNLRRKVGMVFQRSNPFPMSIYDNICYGPITLGVKKKEELERIVEKSLASAALWNEVKDKLGTSALSLSGGQQQRLCIARALAVEPDILLLDEPCSSLDPISTAKIEELLIRMKEDYTIVMVTHNMQQAARISFATAFFYMGELIEYDRTRKMFTNPMRKETEAYVTGRFG